MDTALKILLGVVVVVLVGIVLFTLVGGADSGFMGAIADKLNAAIGQISW